MAYLRDNYYLQITLSGAKLTYVRSVPLKGISPPVRDSKNEKLVQNISRAKISFLDIGQCNNWEYMATFTSGSDTPESDIRKISRWFNDWNTHHNSDIRYLFVFELGERGRRLHCHALLQNVPASFVRTYSSVEYSKLPPDVKRLYSQYKTDSGTRLCTCPWWKYGWSTLIPVDGSPKVVSYMTKYMTKSNIEFTTKFGKHAYFCSKGLNRPIKQKVPVGIAATILHRVPSGCWSRSFLSDDGSVLSACTIMDKDKLPPDFWEYLIKVYSDLQAGKISLDYNLG